MAAKLGLGIVGCGNIAQPYVQNLVNYPELAVIGFSDLDRTRAEALVQDYGGEVFPSLKQMLADERIDVVVNLTIHQAHYAVSEAALQADKHVYSEKPLALTYAEAKQLLDLAAQRDLRLGCSPFTYMGSAQQTAWSLIRHGLLGDVRLIYAEVNHGRLETWHPNPAPFYAVGPMFDVGVYPLTIATTIFGPVKRVLAHGDIIYSERSTLDGEGFSVTAPDFVVLIVELTGGITMRLTVNFYVDPNKKQQGMEFHGDLGSVYLGDWQRFEAPVEFAVFGRPYQAVELLRKPYDGTEWGVAVREMAQAIEAQRPHRATGQQAAHLVEVLEAATQSMAEGRAINVQSTFTPPPPFDWAADLPPGV